MDNRASGTRRTVVVFIVVVAAGLAAGTLWQQGNKGNAADTTNFQGVRPDQPQPLQAFTLTDGQGQPFGIPRLQGRWSLLFFGYTHCPDVCPFTLTEMNRLYKHLAEHAPRVLEQTQFIFVSVDPERDAPKALGEFVAYFNPAFIAATAPRPQLDALTRQLGVMYEYNEGLTPGEYLVDHSASLFLLDRQAALTAVFTPPHQASDISDQLVRIVTAQHD